VLRLARREISRFPCKALPCMPGSPTTPGRRDARVSAPRRFAFRILDIVGTRDNGSFAALWLAYTLPYRRFAFTLAGDCARLGADMDRYSFIAVDLHHLHFAGLPAHPEDPPAQSVSANDGRRSNIDDCSAPIEHSRD
jgi:hypothetical protein